MENLLTFLGREIEVPKAGGIYHIVCIALAALVTFILCEAARNASDKFYKGTMFTLWIVMLALEIIKQFMFSHTVVDGAVVFEYDWGIFPFQLCSTPLYVLPLLAFLPDSWLRDMFASYTMTFALIGGIAVFAVPKSVFTENAFINVQTMVHHGIQIISGIYTAVWYRKKLGIKFYLEGLIVFIGVFDIAMWLNTDFYMILREAGKAAGFNMFMINPNEPFDVPILTELFAKIPRDAISTLYFIGLSIAAALITRFFIKYVREYDAEEAG